MPFLIGIINVPLEGRRKKLLPTRFRDMKMKKVLLLPMLLLTLAIYGCTSQWQYKTVEVEGSVPDTHGDYFSRDFPIDDSFLNQMGADGWELVSCYPLTESVYADMGGERLILHLKTNTRTVSIRYVFKRKTSIL